MTVTTRHASNLRNCYRTKNMHGKYLTNVIIMILCCAYTTKQNIYNTMLRFRITVTVTPQLFQHRDRLYTSESDVCRRQILMYKDGPHAERIKIFVIYTHNIGIQINWKEKS